MSSITQPTDPGPRVDDARARAAERRRRQRGWLRPLGWAMGAAVIAATADGHPAPALHGRGAGVAAALVLWLAGLALTLNEGWLSRGERAQLPAVVSMGAAGVALGALQSRGATEIAGSVAVWVAITRVPSRPGIALAIAITVALLIALGVNAGSSANLLATGLLCALLGVMAHFMRQARENQDRTELLLAELQEARDEQARAAALRERGRIAAELHDVLAHSLSGAAIQLQGARMLAEREGSAEGVRAAIERAGELVRSGLGDARRAVGALRGEPLPGVSEIPELVESFTRDTGAPIELQRRGEPRPLPAEAGLALYRAAQEALTNVARYAPGSAVAVSLAFEPGRTRLVVENRAQAPGGTAPAAEGLPELGGGHGLDGMRERVRRAGGSAQAGPTADGWRVEVEVPA